MNATETRSDAIERWEQEGMLDRDCPSCQEVYTFPGMPWDCFAPPHLPSKNCESGKRPHCTCEVCF